MSRLFELEAPAQGKNMMIDEEKDLSPYNDNGIRKVLKQDGYGDEYPNSGDTVTLRYRAYYGDEINAEYEFDSSYKDNKDFRYEVCRGKVVRGFELAVLTMRVGERAIIYLKPEYAFGRSGAPPKVPRDTSVIFDTTIINIQCQDLSQEKDGSVLKKVMKKGKGYGQPNEGCLVEIHLKGTYDNTTFQDEDLSFPYGEGTSAQYHVPEFVEELLDEWKTGEISRLFFRADKAFGVNGYPDLGVPPNKDVTYTLTMKRFERVKDVWEMNSEEKLSQCDIFKEKGNMYYKSEQWGLALKFYNRILDYVEYDICMTGNDEDRRKNVVTLGFLNKAMALLKLERFNEARECCDKVIQSDNNCVKAWYRRGLTYFNTNDWKEAKSDFEKVVELDPSNKSAKNHISVCNRRIRESVGQERQMYQNMMSQFGRGRGNEQQMYGSGMNNIDNWDNRMAQGMMTLEEEQEAFRDLTPRGGNNHGFEH